MAGTASEFHDYNEVNNMELFSAWLFGRINANCLLSDISRCGCSVLIPGNQSVPSGDFNLLIMCPDDGDRLHAALKTEKIWQDSDYSSTHKKIGIKFKNIEPDQLQKILVLAQYFETSGRTTIKCSLLKN